jgi:excisionase family DNA binding protein
LSQLEKRNVEASDREDSFLTVAEVAETLKLNQQTVRNWIDQGSLPALRVGRRVRIRRSDFDRLLEDGYSGSAGAAAPSTTAGPSADDFWGGEPVGAPATRARGEGDRAAEDGRGSADRFGDEGGSAEHFGDEGGSAEHPSRPDEAEGG